MIRAPALLLGALTATLAGATAQTTASIPCDRDNTLYENATGAISNGAGGGVFVGKNGGGLIRRTLMHFDVAAAVPAGSRVLGVKLVFRIHPSLASGQTASAYRVLQDWGEGSSVAPGNGGGGTASTTNDATWLHRFYPTQLWTNAGGDYVPSASFSMPLWLGLNTSTTTAAAADDVQSWLDNPGQNFGWLLRNSETSASTANRIDSRESGSVVLPFLSVTYLTPGTGGRWGQGCPGQFGNYLFEFVGAPTGGATISMQQANGPANALSAHFFSLELDAVGTALSPGCTAYLPAMGLIGGPTVVLDVGGSATTPFVVPSGFPGYLIACQTAALDTNLLGFSVSNAGVLILQ